MNGQKKNLVSSRGVIVILGVIALLLRFLLIPNPGFEADISFWKSWGLGPFDHGMVWAAHNTNNNYPTPFAYILWLMVGIYSVFADPHNFAQFWSNTNLLFLTIAKLFPIAADFGIAAIILWIGKRAHKLGFPHLHRSWFVVLACLYLFNPIALIDGAWWGQVDSVGVFVFLLSLITILTKRPMLGGVLYMVAVMTKLQNMIYGPIFFLFIWQSLGYQGLMRAIAGSAFAFFGLNIEFFLARDMGRVLSSLTDNFDYFPLLSLNAYNLWWIVARAQGMQISDKILVFGMTNAKYVGLLLFSSSYLFAMLHLFGLGKKPLDPEVKEQHQTLLKRFFQALIIVVSAFFLFQTQSHDRYAFPLSVFLLLWAPFVIAPSSTLPAKRFVFFYVSFSLLYFYNLHTALVVNYPNNGLSIISSLTHPLFTIATSVLLLGFFGLFLFTISRQSSRWTLILPLLMASFLLVKDNLALMTKQPVSLTSFSPIAAGQEYGTRQTNMPVDAGSGFPKWSPLSVQYAFYKTGIGTHAKSFINYDVNRLFTRFSTDFGLDTQAGDKGSAIFEVYGDGKLLFRSEKMGRYDMPRHIDVDIRGVKTLGLVTTDAGDDITDDHTDWLRPTLWP